MKGKRGLYIFTWLALLWATMGCHPEELTQATPITTMINQGTDHPRDVPTATDTPSNETMIPPTIISIAPNSMEGDVIVFQSDRDRQDEIYVMNADGSDQRLLISNQWALDSMPAWSPTGNRIAIASRERSKDFEIYVVNLDNDLEPAGEIAQITENGFDDLHPTWSADGTQIAFCSNRSSKYEIFVIDIENREEHQLTDNAAIDKDPAWSPDGTQVAFVSDRDGDQEIFLMNTNGSNQRAIMHNDANDWSPAWSPDGARMAFISDRNGDQHLFVMDIDGENTRQLTDVGFPWNDDPTWSPDGTKLAFRSNSGGYVDIYLINSDGSSVPQQLTHNAEIDQDRAPAWRPIKTDP